MSRLQRERQKWPHACSGTWHTAVLNPSSSSLSLEYPRDSFFPLRTIRMYNSGYTLSGSFCRNTFRNCWFFPSCPTLQSSQSSCGILWVSTSEQRLQPAPPTSPLPSQAGSERRALSVTGPFQFSLVPWPSPTHPPICPPHS